MGRNDIKNGTLSLGESSHKYLKIRLNARSINQEGDKYNDDSLGDIAEEVPVPYGAAIKAKAAEKGW